MLDIAIQRIEEYCSDLRENGRKERTCTEYFYRLRRMIRFLHGSGRDYLPENIKAEGVTAILNVLLDGKSNKYRRNTVQILSKFCRVVGKNTVIDDMDMLWPASATKVTWLTPDQMLYVFDSTEGMDQMMVHLAGEGGGLRAEELANLMLEDFVCPYIYVLGKGHQQGKLGEVYQHEDTQGLVDRYVKEHRDKIVAKHMAANPDIPVPGNLFLHFRNGQARPYNRKTIVNRFLKMARDLNMDFSAHTFRRSYCTMLEAAGILPPMIMIFMRHKNINDTMRYLERSPLKLLKARKAQQEFMSALRNRPIETRLEYCIEAVKETS